MIDPQSFTIRFVLKRRYFLTYLDFFKQGPQIKLVTESAPKLYLVREDFGSLQSMLIGLCDQAGKDL